MAAWFLQHSSSLRRVLELAAGPADHAIAFAQRGLQATALDVERAMLSYAKQNARKLGVRLSIRTGDMRTFRIDRSFDLAILMLDSASHLYTLHEFVMHLRRVRMHLRPNGLYIMEMAHPGDFLTDRQRTLGKWDVSSELFGNISITWGDNDSTLDPLTQVETSSVSVSYTCHRKRRTLTSRVPQRRWTLGELAAAVQLAGGFRIVAIHGAFTRESRLTNTPSSWRMIPVIKAVKVPC